jgi:putative transposase
MFMRGRKAGAIKDLEQYDFDKLSKTQGNSRERKRYLAFAHIRDGKTFTEAAAAIRIKLRTLMNWVKRFKEQGIDGLMDRAGRGAKPCISPEDRAAFKQSVLELQQKRCGGRIRGSDVLALMKEKYNVEPTLSTVYNTLKRADLVWITGRSIHPKADIAAQENFKKNSEKK